MPESVTEFDRSLNKVTERRITEKFNNYSSNYQNNEFRCSKQKIVAIIVFSGSTYNSLIMINSMNTQQITKEIFTGLHKTEIRVQIIMWR